MIGPDSLRSTTPLGRSRASKTLCQKNVGITRKSKNKPGYWLGTQGFKRRHDPNYFSHLDGMTLIGKRSAEWKYFETTTTEENGNEKHQPQKRSSQKLTKSDHKGSLEKWVCHDVWGRKYEAAWGKRKRKQGTITYHHKASSRRPWEPGRSAVHFRTCFFLEGGGIFCFLVAKRECDCCLRISVRSNPLHKSTKKGKNDKHGHFKSWHIHPTLLSLKYA